MFSLMNFTVNDEEYFRTNSPVHGINTRNKHHLHKQNANLSCFQKSAFSAGIRIFNSLPHILTSLKNEKAQFKLALRRHLTTHCFCFLDQFLYVKMNHNMLHKTFTVFCTVMILCTLHTLYLYDLPHNLLSLLQIVDPWNILCM
jgi:hypothetical protein